jgi:hypothetical protein
VTSERWSNRFTHGLGDSAGLGRFERRARAASTREARPKPSMYSTALRFTATWGVASGSPVFPEKRSAGAVAS